jgi:exodeoxyribonuclease-3
MRIATWNVNSLRSRIERVEAFLQRHDVDVLALQETKAREDQLPLMGLHAAGYDVAAAGTNQWNGVAIVSRVGLDDVTVGFDGMPAYGEPPAAESRAMGATCGGVRVWSVYVPNGREVGHPHYDYKLRWLAALRATAEQELATQRPFALLGDFNIAPTDADVWDITRFATSTHVTKPERDALAALRSVGLSDVTPRPLKYDVPFTYWDYRQLSFPKNRGMRIDLVYANDRFTTNVRDSYVDREARKGTAPSDHAPVVVDVDLAAVPD